MSIVESLRVLTDHVDSFIDHYQHPWAADYLPGAPWTITGIVGLYLLFVLKVGPALMKDRKALELEGLMRAYNAVNVLATLAYVLVGLFFTNFTVMCWSCMSPYEFDTSLSLMAGYGYMALKVFDLLDTVFFILRKKDNQVTTLHLVHHSVMPFTAYFSFKITPCTPTAMTAIVNSFVHVVMYSYYFMASYGPKMKKYLWWKSYITTLQIVQFVVLLVHSVTILGSDCQCNKIISCLQFIECSYFLYGFSLFYAKTYLKGKNAVKDKSG